MLFHTTAPDPIPKIPLDGFLRSQEVSCGKLSNTNSSRNVWIQLVGANVGADVIVGEDVGVDVGERVESSHVSGGTWRSKLGLLSLLSVITSSSAFCMITLVTCAGVRVGSSRRMRAATPAT
jgi:hypothetical protein